MMPPLSGGSRLPPAPWTLLRQPYPVPLTIIPPTSQRWRTRSTVAVRGWPTFRARAIPLVVHGAVSLILVAKQQDAGVNLFIGCRPPLNMEDTSDLSPCCSSSASRTLYLFTIIRTPRPKILPWPLRPLWYPTTHQFNDVRLLVRNRAQTPRAGLSHDDGGTSRKMCQWCQPQIHPLD